MDKTGPLVVSSINSYYISLKNKTVRVIIKSLKWRGIPLFTYSLSPFISSKTSPPTLCVYVSGAQSSPSLCDPIDCGPPGSSVHGILQARILEWVAIPFSRIFLTQGLKPSLLNCRQILYHLSHQGSPKVWWWGRNCLCAQMLRQGWKSPTGTHDSNRGQTMENVKARKGWSTSWVSVRRGAGAKLLEPFGELMKNGFK